MTVARCDLLVVGCGILGATTALLAREARPNWSVLAADQGRPGGGATGWSAGLSDPTATDQSRWRLVRSSLDLFDRPPLSRFVEPVRALVITAERARLAVSAVGPPPVPATGDELAWLRRGYPDLVLSADEDVLMAGLFLVACAELVEALPGHGVDVRAGCRIEHAERTADGWVATTATGAVIDAARMVLATGAWPAPPVEASGEPLEEPALRVKRVAALHVGRPAPAGPRRVVAIPGDDLFILPGPTQTIVSYRRDAWLDSLPHNGSAAFDGDDLAEGVEILRKRSESLAAAVTGGRVAYDGYTPDRLPLVDTRAAGHGLVRVVGGSGSGAHLAPGLAAAAVGALTGAGS
jgi:glycine/D-amino acid oxidase-like deaminating enzyme